MPDSAYHDRLYSTTVGGFHNVIALSEEHINKSFANMHQLALTDDPQSPIVNFNIQKNPAGWIDNSSLVPPRIKLLVAGGETSTLKYYLEFKTGQLHLYTSDDRGDMSTKEFPVSGWVFAFKINLVRKDVPKDSTEYAELGKRVHYENGTFSLAKLFLDATSAEMSGASTDSESKFGTVDWSKETATVRSNWSTYVTKWIMLAAEKHQTLVGLQITPDADHTDATYPPTSVQKQTYAWLDPMSTNPQAQDGNPQNALLYLCMTDNVQQPSPPRLEAHSGTWISAKDDIKGTFAMSASRFWDVWLLPHLNEFNTKLQFFFKPCEASAWWDDGTPCVNSKYYPDCGNYQMVKPEDPPVASFSLGDLPRDKLPYSKGPDKTLTPDTSGAARYHWLGPLFKQSSADQNGSAKPHGRLRIECQQEMWNWSGIWFNPGDDYFTFEMKGNCFIRDDLLGSDTYAWTTGEQFYLTLKFKLTVRIKDVAGGALDMVIDNANDIGKVYTLDGEHTNSFRGTIFSPRFDTYWKDVRSYLDDQIKSHVGSAVTQLQKVLSGQQKLVLPGAGQYLFEKGTFNNRGDFLANIKFNGAEPPKQ